MSGTCQTLDIHPPLDDGPEWCWAATHHTPGGASRTIRFEGGPRERRRRTRHRAGEPACIGGDARLAPHHAAPG